MSDLVERLKERARIRRDLYVQGKREGNPAEDRIANVLDEAAAELVRLREIEWMYEELRK
jgi:hypothetical protein